MLINDYYIVLRFCGGAAELEDNDPSHYMYVTEGTVHVEDEEDRAVEAGRFRLSYIDVSAAVNAGASVFDIFDHTRNTAATWRGLRGSIDRRSGTAGS
jgi:hypothetical protein